MYRAREIVDGYATARGGLATGWLCDQSEGSGGLDGDVLMVGGVANHSCRTVVVGAPWVQIFKVLFQRGIRVETRCGDESRCAADCSCKAEECYERKHVDRTSCCC